MYGCGECSLFVCLLFFVECFFVVVLVGCVFCWVVLFDDGVVEVDVRIEQWDVGVEAAPATDHGPARAGVARLELARAGIARGGIAGGDIVGVGIAGVGIAWVGVFGSGVLWIGIVWRGDVGVVVFRVVRARFFVLCVCD